MNFPYPFLIAFRYFRSKKKHSGISINTLISVAGVALGVMTLLTVLAVMSGFQDDLQKKILGANAHVIVQSYDGNIRDHESVREKINGIRGVTASSPVVYGQVMLRSGSRASGVVVRGIDPVIELQTTDILNKLKAGSIDNLKEGDGTPGIIVGKELLRNLGLFVGDEIEMISPLGEMGPLGMIPKMRKFRVAGFFEAGMFEYDSSLAFINIGVAQKFLGLNDAVTAIEIKLTDPYLAEEVAGTVGGLLGIPYIARDWMQMNRNLFSALKLEKIVMFIILTLIILVASFNIISNLIMTVIEKSREIAIIKAMGATGRGIMSVFMIHGLIIGITGTAVGVLGGYALCQVLKTYKFINLPADVYYLSYLPVKMDPFDFITVPAAAILISFLATVYPSWQAARLDPVESLRYE
ncbi:MAG: lipoprotein-releasing ABC transporter permease subunit [Nitrospiraceae bacterium]|nr:MAG: lipoprotein-releasing ABC transporter permease subunit [Nitrospiraceae bacterium]